MQGYEEWKIEDQPDDWTEVGYWPVFFLDWEATSGVASEDAQLARGVHAGGTYRLQGLIKL